ncbi:uncharacterized protein LOC129590649 [Paramacrobiotus metropolitanus]|uniref:uncharacterized protein LOC129590649 n=1 Tax=Paramacrobiotus metropolitanus TaxID=2943436 RepID=UPI0024461759|nr:uncharacterized protein LOC129590649 [Paramacrobiotus metropolitanus]
MERWRGRTAVVTGASTGIGHAVADALAHHGVKVVGCADLNISNIEELAKKYEQGPGSVEAIECDLTKPEQITAMFLHIEKQYGHVDILVNNAGLTHMDTLLTGRTEKWREIFEVNVLGLCICAREALRLMQKSGVTDGNVINISSIGGHTHIDFPEGHFYSGTKHMVTALTEALHREVRAMEPKNNIRITDISPGIVITEIGTRAMSQAVLPMQPSNALANDYQKLDASDIADSVLFVLAAPQHVNVKTLIVCPTQMPQLYYKPLDRFIMERWQGRTALVTGASSGIGYAIAEALAQKGMKVIGCARNIAKIQELAKKYKDGPGSLEAIQCDISKPEQITAMFEQIAKQHGHVDVLVNNAGLSHADTLMAGRTEKWREVFEVNVLGLCICAREALKLMQKDGIMDGNVININSQSGHAEFHFPEAHFYAGTKRMVTSLTESLHREIRAMEPKNNIRVTDISPGIVVTEIGERSASHADHAVQPPTAFTAQYQKLNSSDIADSVVYVLSAPQHVNVKTLIICPTQQPEL